MNNKVMVAMSGGVDSSVAAALLMEQGFDVVGATLKLFDNSEIGITSSNRTCCSLDDVTDARSVARRLGFDHFVFNFGSLFQHEVIERFAQSYCRGETPNPCIDCNRYIKFCKLLERAQLLDANYIATGHYARISFDEKSGRYLLLKAKDLSKDQSYVLYNLTQDELSKVIFPLGELRKSEVRLLAEQRELVNARKPDSQDICFVPDGDYAGFLKNVIGIPSSSGNFVNRDGQVLGIHQGHIHYTIGQRKGLRLSFDRPKYVVGIDAAANTVTLGDESELYHSEMTIGDLNWVAIERLVEPIRVQVKIRYSQSEVPAIIHPFDDQSVKVILEQTQRAVTPGQAAVFYQGDVVIGGGRIVS